MLCYTVVIPNNLYLRGLLCNFRLQSFQRLTGQKNRPRWKPLREFLSTCPKGVWCSYSANRAAAGGNTFGCGNTRRGGGSGVPGNKTAQKEARRRHSRQEIKNIITEDGAQIRRPVVFYRDNDIAKIKLISFYRIYALNACIWRLFKLK